MTHNYIEIDSISLVIREMSTKTVRKIHLTSVRMIIIKKTNNKFWQQCGERGKLTDL